MDHLEQPHWRFSHPTKPSSPLNAFGKIISAGVALTAAGCITYNVYQEKIDAALDDLCTLVRNAIGEALNDEDREEDGEDVSRIASIGIKDIAQSE